MFPHNSRIQSLRVIERPSARHLDLYEIFQIRGRPRSDTEYSCIPVADAKFDRDQYRANEGVAAAVRPFDVERRMRVRLAAKLSGILSGFGA